MSPTLSRRPIGQQWVEDLQRDACHAAEPRGQRRVNDAAHGAFFRRGISEFQSVLRPARLQDPQSHALSTRCGWSRPAGHSRAPLSGARHSCRFGYACMCMCKSDPTVISLSDAKRSEDRAPESGGDSPLSWSARSRTPRVNRKSSFVNPPGAGCSSAAPALTCRKWGC